MEFYTNYINNLSKMPNESWRDLQQATVTSLFKDTTLQTEVLEEEIPFNQVYHPVTAWVGTVTDPTINAEKDSINYRSLYFENCTKNVSRGRYYQYDNNYWLVYDSTNDLESIAYIKIRRCNNRLKWIDSTTGEIFDYPCAVDYTLSATQPSITANVNSIGGRITIIIQGNKDTHKIKMNTRFLFNGMAYKFNTWNNYMLEYQDSKDADLLFMDCTADTIMPDDDLENNVANAFGYNYSISISEGNFSQVKGFKGKLNATVTLDGQEIDRPVTWNSSDGNVVTIDKDGNYELVGEMTEKANIYASINGSNIQSMITIWIVGKAFQAHEIVLDPVIEEIGLYDTVTISAFLYNNGVKQPDKVDCIPSGLSSEYYTFDKIDNYTYKITNNKISKTPLTLNFKSGEYDKKIDIRLAGLF